MALIWVLFLCGCAGQQLRLRPVETAAYGEYLHGLMLERSYQFSDALEAYQRALDTDARSPLLNVRIGSTYVRMGQTERAQKFFQQALALDPKQPEALKWMAMLQASEGQLDQAVSTYEKLLALAPEDHAVLSTLADLYVLQDNIPKAITLYHRLIQETGSSGQLHFNLGVLHGRLAQFDEAIEELSRALELAPEATDIRVAIALTYELQGRPTAAVAHYEEAIRLDPKNSRLYHYAVRAFLAAEDPEGAVRTYQSLLQLIPHDLDATIGLSRVYLSQKQFGKAQELIGKRLTMEPQAPELFVALGLVYREAGETLEALRAFEAAVSFQDEYAPAHFYMAAQLDELKRSKEARTQLRRTLELDPNHADAMNYLGYLDAVEGVNLYEAKSLIERALVLDPGNGAYLDSLGWVCYKMGRMAEAVVLLERAAKRIDTDPAVFDHLGQVYFSLREWEKARENWQRALQLDSDQPEIRERLMQLAPQQTSVSP
ncbi:MAG: tetratricopeptide repeat protein [Candidatus Omnitrophica bacterium]|nr:tetratricopeptide repeat protein [Candidatus Omnitrophota bacterium]